MKTVLLIMFVLGGTVADDVIGKITVWYRGWYDAPGDNSPVNDWVQWGPSKTGPVSNDTFFETWPDVREYTNLYNTNLANLGNGQPAQLFSSWDNQTVDTHFRWMAANDIDTAEFQRNAHGAQTDKVQAALIDGLLARVRDSAERFNRKFYISWQVFYWDNVVTEIIDDINNSLNPSNIFKSPAYAQQNGKPVVALYGFGSKSTQLNADPNGSLNLINQLKQQGFYVIGGVTAAWRTNDQFPTFQPHYKAFNALSPDSSGFLNSGVANASAYQVSLRDDLAFCKSNSIDYIPTLFPGKSSSNHNGNFNDLPRLGGDYLWQQFKNLKQLNIVSANIISFDDYVAGTNIAKSAEDKSMISAEPNRQFLTLDADGVQMSSDFYLRLVNDGKRLISGEIPLTDKAPTPFQTSQPSPTETIPSITPTATIPSITPTATIPSITPTATIPSITPTATIPSVTPTATIPSIAPTATIPSITPTATIPSITPTATIPSITPTATIPSITPTATIPSITPTATIPSITPTATIPSITPAPTAKIPSITPTPTAQIPSSPTRAIKIIFPLFSPIGVVKPGI